MAAIWPTAVGTERTSRHAVAAKPPRKRSGHNVFDMPQTACATTATATTLRPCTAPEDATPAHRETPNANTMSATADGNVKPHHAASEPSHPARPRPSAMPTWLLVGPGRNWHSATRSE